MSGAPLARPGPLPGIAPLPIGEPGLIAIKMHRGIAKGEPVNGEGPRESRPLKAHRQRADVGKGPFAVPRLDSRR